MPVVTLSSKGQIVLPKEIRQALGLRKGDRLRVTQEGDHIILTPYVRVSSSEAWRRWRGCLTGIQALQSHIAEHAEEIRHERLP
ncbi:MAG TPA: AbrB/MazE/SpoVT family DNA-binding domain-containing protein [Anaerolineae bacterium]|nr:AbrB/MazE/SpoVT family DNA-binding domain-containing protein [Anaerolineae bacterium]